MDAEQLCWDTTLNPETRMLKLIEIEDAKKIASQRDKCSWERKCRQGVRLFMKMQRKRN